MGIGCEHFWGVWGGASVTSVMSRMRKRSAPVAGGRGRALSRMALARQNQKMTISVLSASGGD